MFTLFDRKGRRKRHNLDTLRTKYYDKPDLDSLSTDELSDDLKDQILDYTLEKNYQKIIDAFKASSVFLIDEKPVEAVDCNFYYHPSLQIEGMLCFFRLDSMSLGAHHLSYQTYEFYGRKEPDTLKYAVPFIYNVKD